MVELGFHGQGSGNLSIKLLLNKAFSWEELLYLGQGLCSWSVFSHFQYFV